ncbi:MAG: hypothetical protein H6Q00_3062 [Holophagaceae bacterium]|nr:hypothetical protein [Holophagaceae bacterium]
MRHRSIRGYSLIELLVVLAVVSILAVAGATTLGNRSSGAVRGVLDELEGTLLSAQKRASATGRDVMIATQGNWGGASPALLMGYGEATDGSAKILTDALSSSEAFRVAVGSGGGLRREHLHAGVVTQPNATWWATTRGTSDDITGQPPFNQASSGFQGVLTADPNLFQGDESVGTVRISGANKRFNSTFWIQVVAIASGQPVVGGAMGLLVVQGNGAQVYKFYNPGVRDGGDGKWRKI